jgi:hypothetical protein
VEPVQGVEDRFGGEQLAVVVALSHQQRRGDLVEPVDGRVGQIALALVRQPRPGSENFPPLFMGNVTTTWLNVNRP